KAQRTAKGAFDRMFHSKWTPPGRGLWMMGTHLVNEQKNSAALQTCAFVSTGDMASDNSAEPFGFLMEASMLGIGVGFDLKGADRFTVLPPPNDVEMNVVIEDSREGWVDSVTRLVNAYLVPGLPHPWFDYSEIRPAGEPIRTFGGT